MTAAHPAPGGLAVQGQEARSWSLSEYDSYLGYDCMTGGVRVGPVVLDGNNYGQRACHPISDESLARMMADARLIAAAPDLLTHLQFAVKLLGAFPAVNATAQVEAMRAAIARATGN